MPATEGRLGDYSRAAAPEVFTRAHYDLGILISLSTVIRVGVFCVSGHVTLFEIRMSMLSCELSRCRMSQLPDYDRMISLALFVITHPDVCGDSLHFSTLVALASLPAMLSYRYWYSHPCAPEFWPHQFLTCLVLYQFRPCDKEYSLCISGSGIAP